VSAASAAVATSVWRFAAPSRARRRRVALLTSVLFAVHPVHVEAVAGTVGRAELLCALACFGAYACHQRAALQGGHEREDGAHPDRAHGGGWTFARSLWCFGMVLCVCAAVLAKESGVALIGILVASDLFLWLPSAFGASPLSPSLQSRAQLLSSPAPPLQPPPSASTASLSQPPQPLRPLTPSPPQPERPLAASKRRSGRDRGGEGRCVAARLSLLVGCAAAYAVLRVLLMSPPDAPLSLKAASLADSQLIRRAENPLLFLPTPFEWCLSVAYVQVELARLVLLPVNFCIEYSFNCIPMVESLADPRNLLTCALLLPLGVLLAATLRSAVHCHGGRVVLAASPHLAACAWLVVPWALISHVPLKLGTLVAERTLYLPSFGALLLLAPGAACLVDASNGLAGERGGTWRRGGAARARRGLARRLVSGLGFAVAVGYCAALTMRRSLDWVSDASAFEAALQVCPTSAKLQQQMCTLRSNEGRHREAAAHCARAFAIDDTYCDTHNSMGFVAIGLNDVAAAVRHFNASLTCIFTNRKAYSSLLSIYDFLLKLEPHNATVYEQMASSQALIGDVDRATGLYREAAAFHLKARDADGALRAVRLARAALDQAATSDEDSVGEGRDIAAAAEAQRCTLGYLEGKGHIAIMAERLREAAAGGQLAMRAAAAAATAALSSFESVGLCHKYPRTAAAAAAEVEQLERWIQGGGAARALRIA